MIIQVVIDGGCRGNGMVGAEMYCSYEINALEDSKAIKTLRNRLELGEGTNNQAEVWALIHATRALKNTDLEVRIFTDSRNVWGWLTQGWKRKDPEIRALLVLAENELRRFSRWEIVWAGRPYIESVLGH